MSRHVRHRRHNCASAPAQTWCFISCTYI